MPSQLPLKYYADRELIALSSGTFLFPRLVERSTCDISKDRDLIACGVHGTVFAPSSSEIVSQTSKFLVYEQLQAGVPGLSECWDTDGSVRPGTLGVMHRDFLDDREIMALAVRRGDPMALMWASPRL